MIDKPTPKPLVAEKDGNRDIRIHFSTNEAVEWIEREAVAFGRLGDKAIAHEMNVHLLRLSPLYDIDEVVAYLNSYKA